MNSNIPISSWERKEILSPSAPPTPSRQVLSLSVPVGLAERRIYLYLEVNQSSVAAYFLGGNIVTKRNGNIVGTFPATIANFLGQTPNQCAETLFTAGGSPVGDTCLLQLAQPFVPGINSVVIQPLRINGDLDEVSLDLVSVTGATLTGWRAFLGCLSTKF